MNILNKRGYEIAGWVCVAIVAVATVYEFYWQDWSGVLVLGVFLLASVIFILQRSRLPTLFSFLFALAALINSGGWVLEFWDKIPGYDPVAHAFTTFAGALAIGFLVFHSTQLHFREHGWNFAVAIAAFGLAIGGLWEIFEWSVGIQQSSKGVVIDLIADSIGGLVAGLLASWAVRNRPPEEMSR